MVKNSYRSLALRNNSVSYPTRKLIVHSHRIHRDEPQWRQRQHSINRRTVVGCNERVGWYPHVWVSSLDILLPLLHLVRQFLHDACRSQHFMQGHSDKSVAINDTCLFLQSERAINFEHDLICPRLWSRAFTHTAASGTPATDPAPVLQTPCCSWREHRS